MKIEKDTIKRFAQESKYKKREKEIVCPYCNHEQDIETKHNHVSYWGDDSLTTINCESCSKDFWVEEHVSRDFVTTTMEWKESYDKYIQDRVEEELKKQQEKK